MYSVYKCASEHKWAVYQRSAANQLSLDFTEEKQTDQSINNLISFLTKTGAPSWSSSPLSSRNE